MGGSYWKRRRKGTAQEEICLSHTYCGEMASEEITDSEGRKEGDLSESSNVIRLDNKNKKNKKLNYVELSLWTSDSVSWNPTAVQCPRMVQDK